MPDTTITVDVDTLRAASDLLRQTGVHWRDRCDYEPWPEALALADALDAALTTQQQPDAITAAAEAAARDDVAYVRQRIGEDWPDAANMQPLNYAYRWASDHADAYLADVHADEHAGFCAAYTKAVGRLLAAPGSAGEETDQATIRASARSATSGEWFVSCVPLTDAVQVWRGWGTPSPEHLLPLSVQQACDLLSALQQAIEPAMSAPGSAEHGGTA